MSNDDDDRQLFEEALASMSAGDVFRGKFGNPEDAVTDGSNDPNEEDARAEIQRLREEREMENAFAGVERIRKGKYHVPAPKSEGDGAADADALRAEFEAALSGPQEPAADVPAPRRSLAEAAPDDVHSLNLRGFAPTDALVKLGLFVDLASKDGHELIRIRIGSNPPLLDEVERWFKDAGLVYIRDLEVVQRHADAAIFAQIRRANPS